MLYDVILGVGESPLPIIYASSESSTFVLGKHRDSRLSHAKREANRIERVLRKARMYLTSTAIAGCLTQSVKQTGLSECLEKHGCI